MAFGPLSKNLPHLRGCRLGKLTQGSNEVKWGHVKSGKNKKISDFMYMLFEKNIIWASYNMYVSINKLRTYCFECGSVLTLAPPTP